MNQNFKDTQKQEAIKRMRMLELHENVIKEFIEENRVNISEKYGETYFLEEDDEKLVRDWEKETDNLVYHVIRTYADFGELLSILFVSKYVEDWDFEIQHIENNIVFAYVINLDDDTCSEYGSIAVRKIGGKLVRIG